MYRILVLTDHTAHTVSNSLYQLCQALAADDLVDRVDVATRGVEANDVFFEGRSQALYVTPVTSKFVWKKRANAFRVMHKADAAAYDVIMIRLPPPLTGRFIDSLKSVIPERRMINSPTGIIKTGNKRFLLEVKDLCAPIRLLENAGQVREMLEEFPIVLKPLNTYGGFGIVRIMDGTASDGIKQVAFDEFIESVDASYFPILGMQYLRNVSQGDKRTVVVNGNIIGSTLRLPAKNSWLCNVSQGGTSRLDSPDEAEEQMAEVLSARLKQEGIIIFGFDTLVNDSGKRVLSELNTTSVGGLVHMERDDTRDVLNSIVQHIVDYIDLEIYGE